MKIWLIEISGTAIRGFSTKARAEQYAQCMLEEELCPGEPMYLPHEIEIYSLEVDEQGVDFPQEYGIIIYERMIEMTNLEMQNLIGMMLVITGLAVFVVLTQILDVIQ